jgi:hypothetical protein
VKWSGRNSRCADDVGRVQTETMHLHPECEGRRAARATWLMRDPMRTLGTRSAKRVLLRSSRKKFV